MKFRVKVKLLSLTTIGAVGNIFIDKTTIRKYGKPVIPATSIRGAMRTAFCYVAKEKGYPCCCSKGLSSEEPAFVKLKDGRPLCITCLLFGRDYWEPLIRIEDCMPKKFLTNVRTRTSLNKALGTVNEGKLFTVEEIAPGSVFECEGEIDFDKLNGNELDLSGKNVEEIKRIIKDILLSEQFKDVFLYVGLGNGVGEIEIEVKE